MHVLLKIGGPRGVTYFKGGPEMCDMGREVKIGPK